MTGIDPSRTYRAFEKRLAATTNERHRVVLNVVLEHSRLEAEPVWDLDKLMATVVAEPAYYIWMNGTDVGPKGVDEVRAFYTAMLENFMNFVEMDIETLVVDDGGVVIEGFTNQVCPGMHAEQMGLPIDDPDADYVMVSRTAIFIPVDEQGLITGEHVYNSGPTSATKLRAEDLPPGYAELRRASA